MFIALQGVAQVVQMAISDFPKRVTAFESKTGKETNLIQWNVVSQSACSVGFVLPNASYYKILAYNKRNKICGEAEVSVLPCPPELVPRPSGRRRIMIGGKR